MILKYHEIANTELKELQQLMNDHQIKAKELANLNQLLSEQKAQTDKARLRAEDLATEKSRFLSLMSHEIRTPLNGIIGGCELLKNQELRADQVVPFQMMEESVNGLNNLVNRILEFSQLEDKAVSLQNEEVALHTILQSTLNLFIRNAADKKLALSMEFLPGCPEYIHVDPHRFTQVLMNVLENAIKFTQRGSITLRTEMIMSNEARDSVPLAMRISVIDSGSGISHEDQKRIFSFFEIGDSSNNRNHGGIGMGLAIVKHLMSLMEGSVQIESRLGVGTQVILSWPFGSIMSKPVPAAHKSPSTKNGHNTGHPVPENDKPNRYRILIVDDNRINQLLASKFLAKMGIDYDVAENGQIAIDKYKSGHFDMIFMDLQMPVLDGYGASLEIRQFDKSVPIIAISANARSEVASQIRKAGMNEFLPKPVTMTQLDELVGKYLKSTSTSIAN